MKIVSIMRKMHAYKSKKSSIISDIESGRITVSEAATKYKIHLATVYRWMKTSRKTSKRSNFDDKTLIGYLNVLSVESNNAFDNSCAMKILNKNFSTNYSRSAIRKILRRIFLKAPFLYKGPVPIQQNAGEKLIVFNYQQIFFDPKNMIFRSDYKSNRSYFFILHCITNSKRSFFIVTKDKFSISRANLHMSALIRAIDKRRLNILVDSGQEVYEKKVFQKFIKKFKNVRRVKPS